MVTVRVVGSPFSGPERILQVFKQKNVLSTRKYIILWEGVEYYGIMNTNSNYMCIFKEFVLYVPEKVDSSDIIDVYLCFEITTNLIVDYKKKHSLSVITDSVVITFFDCTFRINVVKYDEDVKKFYKFDQFLYVENDEVYHITKLFFYENHFIFVFNGNIFILCSKENISFESLNSDFYNIFDKVIKDNNFDFSNIKSI